MKKALSVLVIISCLLVVGFASAQQPPRINTFTTSAAVVDRVALANRTAGLPVTWETTNRPITANLLFEQLLPDGSTINIELPRLIPWVPSRGTGLAAPILPAADAADIVLRLRLVGIFDARVYDEELLTIPIGIVGDLPSPFNSRPTITDFSTTATAVAPDALSDQTERVPVRWSSINRPLSATFVFEQILPDGSAVNIELPRENSWVNSSGEGEVAPIAPGENASAITLRVRLIDALSGRTYDQRTVNIGIGTPLPPQIMLFSTNATTAIAEELRERQLRLPVVWAVENRPTESNLVFEQVLPDGSVVNVELPREAALVPSFGSGVVLPFDPGEGVSSIRLIMQLVDLNSTTVYDRREIELPIQTCPYRWFFDTNGCPVEAPQNIDVNYQAFENGAMLRRGDTGEIYVLFGEGNVGLQGVAGTQVIAAPPEGFFPPSSTFEAVWASHILSIDTPRYIDLLGWAITPEQSYIAQFQRAPFNQGTQFSDIYITLPDGSIVRLEGTFNRVTNWSPVD